jgi:DNA repair protein RadC
MRTRNRFLNILVMIEFLDPPEWEYKVAEIELIYKTVVKPTDRTTIGQSGDMYKMFLQFWDKSKINLLEQFKVAYLNQAKQVVGLYNLSTGGINSTTADSRLILKGGLDLCATSMIICHNHPSGNLQPSEGDKIVTQKIKLAGLNQDIKLIDHLIITPYNYLSFADQGIL